MFRSWLAGGGFFTALHYWLIPHLTVFAVPVLMLVGLVWVPFGLAARVLLRPPLGPMRVAGALIVLPAVWLVLEYARSWDRLGGSWGFLGLTQWKVPAVLSVVALGGVWVLSFLLLVTNVAATVDDARALPADVLDPPPLVVPTVPGPLDDRGSGGMGGAGVLPRHC